MGASATVTVGAREPNGRRSTDLPGARVGVLLVLLAVVGATAFVVAAATAPPVPQARDVLASAHPAAGPSLTLSVSSGAVGASVNASGTGLPANANLHFVLDGVPAASSCATDGSGNFPPAGSSCHFTVPAVPAGTWNVTAFAGWNVHNVTLLGSSPDEIAYDGATNELYVTNAGSDNVSVVDASSGQVTANITVGTGPIGVAYDAGVGEVFVANSGGGVSVISDRTHRVVATVGAGGRPLDLGYDPVRGAVFVGNSLTDNASVINDTAHAVVANITLGNWPGGMAYDAAHQAMYVANPLSDDVSVIDDVNNTVVATVPVGANPFHVAYDPVLGEIFVSEHQGSSVTVINDSTNQVVGTIGVGNTPTNLVYDAATAQVLVTNSYSNNVSVIADAAGVVTANIDVGYTPGGIAYDNWTGGVYVADQTSPSGTLVELSPVGASGRFSVVPSLSTAGRAEVGTPLAVRGSGFGRGLAITSFDLGTLGLPCTAAQVGQCVGGTIVTDASGSFAVDATVPSLPHPGNWNLTASDSAGHSASVLVNVLGGPSVATPTPSAPSVDLGQSVDFTASPQQGAGGYSFVWNGLPNGCAGANASVLRCTPTQTGDYAVSVTVTDAAGRSVTSANLGFPVYADPSVATPIATPATIDLGASATFFTSASGGTGLYNYSWSGLPAGCSSTGPEVRCTPTASGTFQISVRATDSDNYSVASASEPFTVVPTYLVTFTESGLPSGTAWVVVLGDQAASSATPNVTLRAPNGTYQYVVVPVPGYVTAAAGTVSVQGQSLRVPVSFHRATFPVVFVEFGLPAGANWSVTVSNASAGFNQTASSIGSSILFFLPNGTYTVTYHLPNGYGGNVTSTQITVAGRSTGASVAVQGGSAGLAGAPTWALEGAVAAAAALALALAVVTLRGRRPPEEGFGNRSPLGADPEELRPPATAVGPRSGPQPAEEWDPESGGRDPLNDVF